MAPSLPPYALEDAALLAQCQQEAMLGHGPGGQHRNRTASAVRLTHRATGLEARCEEHRERARNQAGALVRLRLRLAIDLRATADPAWLEPYRQGRQLRLGQQSRAYPLAVACCLAAIDRAGGHLPAASASLGCSSSQLAKLVTADKEVHEAANRLRALHGQGPIHE